MRHESKDQYSAIKFHKEEPLTFYLFEPDFVLDKLSLINIFVGSNNSGKSRLLRHIFRSSDYECSITKSNSIKYPDDINKLRLELETILPKGVISIGNIRPQHFDDLFAKYHNYKTIKGSLLEMTLTKLKELASERSTTISHESTGISPNIDPNTLLRNINDFGKRELSRYEALTNNNTLGNEKKIYVPMIRGMRPFDEDKTNYYTERTKKDYFGDSINEDQEIFSGLELYQKLKSQLLGEPEERKLIYKFEKFLSENFFDAKSITLIPREGDNTVHIKIGNEKQLPIYHLGDGIQNLIIVTYNIFTRPKRCLFFIEEPDLCMHPGLQRKFLEVLFRYDQHQYFITTHSNHLLDMTLDYDNLSVYLFEKEENNDEITFRVNIASSQDFNIMQSLGVRNSSVFLTNATIWVEGITDRLYLREYFNKYQEGKEKQFQEDIHYSFVEYQGSNLTHWTFENEASLEKIKANFLCARSFLIADGDISNKGTREEDYKEALGDRFHILPCKEIENLLPEAILKKLVKEKFTKMNKEIDQIKYEDYSKKVGLGKYLDRLLGLKEKSEFSTNSGTVKNKVAFCEKAIDLMKNNELEWSLTPEISSLCEKLYNFIEKQNR